MSFLHGIHGRSVQLSSGVSLRIFSSACPSFQALQRPAEKCCFVTMCPNNTVMLTVFIVRVRMLSDDFSFFVFVGPLSLRSSSRYWNFSFWLDRTWRWIDDGCVVSLCRMFSKRIVRPPEVLLTFTPEVYLSDVIDRYMIMYSVSPHPGCTPTIRSGPAQEKYGSGLRGVAANSLVDRAAKDHLSKSELLQNCLPTFSAAS